jgi:hypothetical protein
MVSSGLLRRVALVRTEVSEEPGASFIRVTKFGELGTTQAATSNRRTLRRNTKSMWPQGTIPTPTPSSAPSRSAEGRYITRQALLWTGFPSPLRTSCSACEMRTDDCQRSGFALPRLPAVLLHLTPGLVMLACDLTVLCYVTMMNRGKGLGTVPTGSLSPVKRHGFTLMGVRQRCNCLLGSRPDWAYPFCILVQ